ncbi:hypothetical protein ASPZODRAFT_132413 [Penicilliopsis zonata CBS 506.65]|uniref:ER membrane protein complex subunit 10 n=1 Tax=Penicilliopsis zonata CBS 506.65 TaxID=1073090 RepID=A0A1L9SGN9_9EURO|nr:hypothetical protein ASPZODRAFT_132413 [Penicilliopsis zonata CBS 506.65]OJJ46342.1 hypothetical protein ASPZODRAFT_132413 [Penicilliopsis zonata CBS 506.65]
MHISLSVLLPLFSFLPLLAKASGAAAVPSFADVLYWPLGASQPSQLARISYDPLSLTSTVVSYTAPDSASLKESPDDLVRIGLYTTTSSSKEWVGSLATLSSIIGDTDRKPTIQLHLSPSREVYHVSVLPSDSSVATNSPEIKLISSEAGPRPHLNRPIVVNPDGTGPEEVVEKTFFQKYWWVFLIVGFIAMSGGGEGQ